MTDASFASLSPRLLARKGGAKPAMRSQMSPLGNMAGSAKTDLEDLGWNDLGDDGGMTPVQPPAPVIHSADIIAIESGRAKAGVPIDQMAATKTIGGKSSPRPSSSRAQAARKRADRLAFTLRLDPERHLKLRLACTIRHCSAQQLVTDALDALLGEMPDIQNLAAQLGRT